MDMHVIAKACNIIIELLSPIRFPAIAGPATVPSPTAGIAKVMYFPLGSEFLTSEYKNGKEAPQPNIWIHA